MKLRVYAKVIEALAKKYPDVDVVYARDEEGNGFSKAHYAPVAGRFNEVDNSFFNIDADINPDDINCICLN
jgi:hypothetical protein